MPSKVILRVTKGELAGKEFTYLGKEQLFIGRQADCAIVLPDKSVSRYHCMMEVTPPYVTVRDFGSLNGTFLNGEKIGQRERSISAEDAQKECHEEFDLQDGNTLGLGKHCELTLHTIQAQCCVDCGEEVFEANEVGNGETTPDELPKAFANDKGEPICEACNLKREAKKREEALADLEKERIKKEKAEAACMEKVRLERERLEGEEERKEVEALTQAFAKKLKAAANKAATEEAEREHMETAAAAKHNKAEEELQRKQEEQRKRAMEEDVRCEAERKRLEEMKDQKADKKCIGCGRQFTPKTPDNNLCPQCVEDRDKLLRAMMLQALGAVLEPMQKGRVDSATTQRFRKVKRLGAGGMGEVWLVQEEKTGINYALKTMLPQVAADEHAKKSFLREAQLGEALTHKNVIRVYKTSCESGAFFILMELCEGGSVDKYMERCGGKLPLDVATYIMLQALDGLEYAHHANISVECEDGIRQATGVVHRDFKPGNIFLADDSKYPVAKVADFGFAKAFETAGLSRHTRTGTAAATPVFQPRQQIANYKYAKPEVDVWAAAASYYNMLTGCIPKDVRGKDVWIEMYTGMPVPIRRRDPKIPEKLAAVIDHALVEIPEIGVKTAAEFKSQIVKALPLHIRHTLRGIL
ncbi:MAG: FHA domain-containing protein [Clostridia bacterium]|nr:FHA domain-containing protein [Clostridia bacterium]